MGKRTLFVSALAWLCVQQIFGAPTEGDLLLTPFIKSGELDKARAQAEASTKLLQAETDVKSYSGYLTIDEKSNSNLFFWFFPAQQNPDDAPVILWVNELAGFTSLKDIIFETGPFQLDENNKLRDRNATWTKAHSMLYIDAPVGTGFSFTNSEEAYANNSDEEATEIHVALKQFFALFNDFQPRDFYLAGESYAATLIPYLGRHIDQENPKSDVKINLKGFIIGSPFLDVKQDLERGQALFNFGLIDEEQKKLFDETMSKGVSLIKEGKTEEGLMLASSTVFGPNSLLEQTTGFTDFRNVLISNILPDEGRFQKFIDSKEVHNYLHVGLHKFIDINLNVYNRFAKEFINSHEDVMQEMLDKGYRVLLYGAQFDMVVPVEGLTKIINGLTWKGADDWRKSERKIWRVNGDVAGYIKISNNFAYAMIRNAGNFAIRDQPVWALDLVERFLYNKEF